MQLFFSLIHARHIFKRDFLLLHGEQARAALAEAERLVSTSLHLADHEEPERSQQNQRSQVQYPARPGAIANVLDVDTDALIPQRLVHVGIVRRDGRMKGGIIALALAANFHTDNRNFADNPLVHVGHELRKVDFCFFLAVAAGADYLPEQESRDNNYRPEQHRLNR